MCTCSKGKTSLGFEAASYFFIFSPRKKKPIVSSLFHPPKKSTEISLYNTDRLDKVYQTRLGHFVQHNKLHLTTRNCTAKELSFLPQSQGPYGRGGEGREGYCSKFWWGRVAPFSANQNMPLSLPTQFEALPKEPPYHFWSQNCRVSRFWVWLQKRACTLVHGQINKSQISRNLLDLYLT